jgi:hypothetical protein
MKRVFFKATVVSLVTLAGLASAQTAMAYSVGPGSSGSAPGSASCGQAFTFSGTLVQPDGTPFPAGVPISFSESSGPGSVSFSPSGTATDGTGSFSTIVRLPSSCSGQFVICAIPEGGGTPICVTVTGVALEFPNTVAALVPQHPRELLPVAIASALLLAAAALAALVGAKMLAGRKTNEKPAV